MSTLKMKIEEEDFFLPITRQNGRKQQEEKYSSELAFENWLMPQKCPKEGTHGMPVKRLFALAMKPVSASMKRMRTA